MEEAYKRFVAQEEQTKMEELEKCSSDIDSLLYLSKIQGFDLSLENFDYVSCIGVVAHSPSLLAYLLTELNEDKEGLVSISELREKFTDSISTPGYIYRDKFIAMVHPYFRQGMYPTNPIDIGLVNSIWSNEVENSDAYIALDQNAVLVKRDTKIFVRDELVYGAPFKSCIGEISDSPARIEAPKDIGTDLNRRIFGNTYALDILWTEKNGIKTFKLLEFKQPDVVLENEESSYHPVRYIHAEYDIKLKMFRHFDGAVHQYSQEQYFKRRDSNFNIFKTPAGSYKPFSKKLFKINGALPVSQWADICCKYLCGNPLIIEYFTGEYPEHVAVELSEHRAKTT